MEPTVEDPRPKVKDVYRNHADGCILEYEHPGGCQIELLPHWEGLARWFANAIATRSYAPGKPTRSALNAYTDIIRYLALTDQDALKRLMEELAQ